VTFPPGPAVRVSRGWKPFVALSFDAGSDAGYASAILDELARDGVHASFGVTGKWAEQNPDLFRRIVAEGHHLINHTYDHQSMTGRSTHRLPLDRAARIDEIEHADKVFVAIAGKSSKPWFRPPYGDIDPELDSVLGDLGYHYDTLWTVDSLGWKGLSSAAISDRCSHGIAPGAVFLFHVGSQSQDAAALGSIIAGIRSAGLQPGSLLDVM
jgi:peptidoglycan/xylan/chitin deacetylase (PgdA/CDA1 family)